jgi:3-oxosteroid 1-dehydrogenase
MSTQGQDEAHWDEEFDVVVVGTGNGALTSAIVAHDAGAKVLILEKSAQFGGSSASSGGGVWVPNNRYAKEAGADDSLDDARAYLEHVSPAGKINPELIETYIQRAPEMIDYLHEKTQWVRYESLEHYPDYFPESPGGKTGHRSMEPEQIHGSALGNSLYDLAPQHPETQMPGGVNFTQVEAQVLMAALPGWVGLGAKLVLKYLSDFPARFRSRRDARLTMGNAGIARLFLSVRDRSIPIRLQTPMLDLIADEADIVGVIAEQNGKKIRIRARQGVILAAGGFERNQEMREQNLPQPTSTDWSAGNVANTGDSIQAAVKHGAATHQMDWAWWFTTACIPGREKATLSMIEKSMPGCITVNKKGARFSNESQNYVSFVSDIYKETADGRDSIPCYMVFDADFRRNRPVTPALVQGKLFPDWLVPKSWWTPEFLCKADSLEALAKKVGIDAEGLSQTVATFNEYARTGKDLEFNRGDSSYDRYYSDPSVTPNPCLGPVLKAPFYAMALYPGEMGTAGGMVIDSNARVLRSDNSPIEGLYACGNNATALIPSYAGPGSTLGPAMTFGYLAARHITSAP